jgi:hypothetical protein
MSRSPPPPYTWCAVFNFQNYYDITYCESRVPSEVHLSSCHMVKRSSLKSLDFSVFKIISLCTYKTKVTCCII